MFPFVWFLTFFYFRRIRSFQNKSIAQKLKHFLPIATGQNCTFPSNWINKDFTVMFSPEIISPGFWNFSETTLIAQLVKTWNFECFQIVGRFVIVRNIDAGWLRCFAIEINNADSFTALYGPVTPLSHFTNECSLCIKPSMAVMHMTAVGYVAQNQTRPACNVPVGCTPRSDAFEPIICDDNGNIEIDGNKATTPPSPPQPKRCKHRHPWIR